MTTPAPITNAAAATQAAKLTLPQVLAATGDYSHPHPHGGVQVFYRGQADRRYWDLSDAKVIANLSGPSLHIVRNDRAAATFLGSY